MDLNEYSAFFNHERTEYIFQTIKKQSRTGKYLYTLIKVMIFHDKKVKPIKEKYYTDVKSIPEEYHAEIITETWTEGGKIRKAEPEIITQGKNIGKKNETNVFTQAVKNAHGKYKKKLGPEILPMLVAKANSSVKTTLLDSDYKAGVILQRKLNGIRAISTFDGCRIRMITRAGHEFQESVKYIKEDLESLFHLTQKSRQFRGIYLDGELYKHGVPLNQLSGHSRRLKDPSDLLEYHIYDCFWPEHLEILSKKRQEALNYLFDRLKFTRVYKVKNYVVKNEAEIQKYLKIFDDEGYEGGIVRRGDKTYEYGINNYHSSHILKFKKVNDEEFRIVDYKSGEKGKDVNAIIFICETEDGQQFNVVPNLTLEERKDIYLNLTPALFKKYFYNRKMTVAYAELSEFGVPTQPKGVFRTYEYSYDYYLEFLKYIGK